MSKITIEVPDQLIEKFENKQELLKEIFLNALEEYLEKETVDKKKLETWSLFGSLEITDPDPEFIVQGENGVQYTNYSENADKVLY